MHREALKSIANEKIVPPIIVAKNIDIVDLPQKERNFAELCKKTCICQKNVVLLRRKSLNNRIMEAAVRQPAMPYAGTISDEKWDSLHTIDELDASLKSIIHNHFHG